MSAPTAAARDPGELLVARYEQLRCGVLEERFSGDRHGLALFVREGMAAWVEAWSLCLIPATPTPSVASPSQEVPLLPQGLHREMVHVLANITLNQLQQVSCRRYAHEA